MQYNEHAVYLAIPIFVVLVVIKVVLYVKYYKNKQLETQKWQNENVEVVIKQSKKLPLPGSESWSSQDVPEAQIQMMDEEQGGSLNGLELK